MKKFLLLILVISLFNCKTVAEKPNDNNNSINKKWNLIQLNTFNKSKLLKYNVHIDLTKNDTGNAYTGCNAINFKYTTKKNTINFSTIIATKMFCNDTNTIENSLIKALTSSKNFRLTDKYLYLITDTNETLKFEASK